MLKVVCAIIIDKQKTLVTQLRDESHRASEWEFPGGKIERGERAEDAIVREIKEELSVEIKITKPMIAIIHNDSEKNFVLTPFLCKIQSGEIKLVEHQDMHWVCFDELEKMNLSEADRQMIQQPGNLKILKKYAGENMHNPC